MHRLGTHFSILLKNIQPPHDRLEAAKELPAKVREFVEKHQDFRTLYPHTRLAGSYAQDTSVGDVKDVDFLVRVPGDPNENEPEAKKLISALRAALNELPEALGYEGFASIDDITIEGARRSVHIIFQNQDFHIDVVPCVAPDGFGEVLYVPDRGFNKWIASHPIGYIDLIVKLDDEHGGKVRPLIKLLKHFRNVQMVNRKPKSYWLGALVLHHVQKEDELNTSLSLAELFRDLCDAIYQQYDHLLTTSDIATPNIPDPVLGHNVSWNWSRTHFETFMRRIDDGRKWASKALASDEVDEAILNWQKIFGEDFFPADVTKEADAIAASILPGASFVSEKGLVLPNKPASGIIYTPVQKTKYHGQE